MSRIKGDKADNIEQAITYFFAALHIYTEEDFPFLWALTQSNLGAVYNDRIKGDKADNLEQAIACLTAALHIHTKDALPFEWANTQNNLGAAYPYRVKGDKAENLEQAIAYLTAALRVYTEDALPFLWARTQNNLGTTYIHRIRGDKADNLEQAIACLTAVLHIHTKDALPFEWARAQLNLGETYVDRIKGDKADNLNQAITHYVAALSLYTEDALPELHRMTALRYAETLAGQQRWNKVHSAYLSALRVEEVLYALAGGAKGQDAILAEGFDGAARDAYALVRLGRLGEAAVTLEQGRARGLAAAQALYMVDLQRITDPARRTDFLAKREASRQSLIALQQPEKHRLSEVSSIQHGETRLLHAEQNTLYLANSKRFRQNQAAFHATVEAIRTAGDPADFLDDHVTEASLLAATQCGPAGHAIISLVATPWGGMALGAFSAHPDRRTTARFAALDLEGSLRLEILFLPISHCTMGRPRH